MEAPNRIRATLSEDMSLAKMGNIRMDDGTVKNVGFKESYAVIDERKRTNYYSVKVEASVKDEEPEKQPEPPKEEPKAEVETTKVEPELEKTSELPKPVASEPEPTKVEPKPEVVKPEPEAKVVEPEPKPEEAVKDDGRIEPSPEESRNDEPFKRGAVTVSRAKPGQKYKYNPRKPSRK